MSLATFVQGIYAPSLSRRQIVNLKTGFLQSPYDSALTKLLAMFGSWFLIPYAATNVRGNGAMTVTLADTDQHTLQYSLMGKRLELVFTLRALTIGGTPDTTIELPIPGTNERGEPWTSAIDVAAPCVIRDNGTVAIGIASVVVGGTVVRVQKVNGAAWAASANDSGVEGALVFQVN